MPPARQNHSWPDPWLRRTALWVAGLSSVALVLFSWASSGSAGAVPQGTRLIAELGFLSLAIDEVGGGQRFSGAWLLVAVGDPRIFAAGLVVLGAVAVSKRDLRLAAVCVAFPVIAEVLTQYVAKPTFFALHGGVYGYPSGHATAGLTLSLATYFLLRRLWGSSVANKAALPLTIVALGSVVGVVITDMHPTRDAVGAIFMSLAVMSFGLRTLSPRSKTSESVGGG